MLRVAKRSPSPWVSTCQTTTFAYDADGQRVLTTRHDGTIIYTPSPDYELEDPPGANNDITRTTYRLAGQMVGVRVKTPTGNTFYYPLTDHLGNVVAMSWRGAGVVPNSHARYDPFGNFRTTPTATNPSLTSRGFTGHAHNNTGVYPTQNVGLIYMNARYYLPEVGRFISADTIVPEPGNPQAFNRYGYGLNNPLKYRDPSGHWFESALDIAFIAYDIYDIQQNGLNWVSGLSLAADVVGLIVPVGTGGGVAVRALAHGDDLAKAATHVDDAVDVIKAASQVEDVRQARQGAEVTQSVLDQIIPSRFDTAATARFGPAFYVAQHGETAVREVAENGGRATHVIRYQLDLSKARVLDLTDPAIARAWEYVDDVNAKASHRQLSARAMGEGYNAIKYSSYRGRGYNLALLDTPSNPFNFDDWLSPQMVSPAP